MADSDLALLIRRVPDADAMTLVVADENAGQLPPNPFRNAQLLSNRIDVCTAARAAGWPSTFADFDFTGLQPRRALYRLSKEKRVVEHVLQSLWQVLPVGGELYLVGYKNEGIRTFAKRAAEGWQCGQELERERGQLHLYRFTKGGAAAATPLNDDDYHELRVIGVWQEREVWSKPGIFAWDRIDEGSRLLLDYLPTFLRRYDHTRQSALDLGCGYGLLALALQQAGCARVVGTDNNAAAVRACEFNLRQAAGNREFAVTAADCGEGLHERFDLLVCNPPFHQGFGVERDLTDRFLQAAARLLKNRGRALFVVNSFIPLERKAAAIFADVATVADNRRYKLVVLQLSP